ncbi:MAG: redoxin domain-containing protein [Stappiaceae bacterium]
MKQLQQAPELVVSQWFNADKTITLEALRGRVIVMEAFQMLCPGCVSHGLPQAQQIAALFPSDKVSVIGLHTVFEHHAAMTPVSLEAFIHEYRLSFPIGVDEAGPGGMPRTMAAYGLRGTPSLVIIDQNGILRANHFGQVHDLQVGAEIATLLAERATAELNTPEDAGEEQICDENGCPLPASGVNS